jgi:hypothetical protein
MIRLTQQIMKKWEALVVTAGYNIPFADKFKEDHENYLKACDIWELIMRAMPLMGGQPTKCQEIKVIGWIGY